MGVENIVTHSFQKWLNEAEIKLRIVKKIYFSLLASLASIFIFYFQTQKRLQRYVPNHIRFSAERLLQPSTNTNIYFNSRDLKTQTSFSTQTILYFEIIFGLFSGLGGDAWSQATTGIGKYNLTNIR